MANMTKNTTTGKYELELTPSTSAQTKTIKVADKYCDCDIDIKVNAVAVATWGTSATGTLQKTVTPSNSIQYVNITAGYTTGKYVKINAIPRKKYNILSTMMGTSYYYKISGEATIYIYKGNYTNSITVKDTIIRLRSLSNSTSSLTLNYSIINKSGTSSDIGWSSKTLVVSGSGTSYGCYILTNGEVSFSTAAPTYRSLTSTTSLPSPYVLNTAYKTASAIRLYTYASWSGSGGGSTSSYKWINASYFKITSITKTTASSGYSGSASIQAAYSDDGVTWTGIICAASKGGSGSSSISSSVGISFFDIVDDILLEPDSYE